MKKKIFYGIGALVTVAIVAFAYYAISPLFTNVKIDEALPAERAAQESPQSVLEAAGGEASVPEPASFPVVGTPAHPASGLVRIVEADGKRYARYENYKTINGPDLYVYLAKDTDANEFVSLGRVRATEGNINYEIPIGVDVSDYRYVLTWCKAFGVLFNYVDLTPGAGTQL